MLWFGRKKKRIIAVAKAVAKEKNMTASILKDAAGELQVQPLIEGAVGPGLSAVTEFATEVDKRLNVKRWLKAIQCSVKNRGKNGPFIAVFKF